MLGALFIILLPPGQSPDELNHFRRAYSISIGNLMEDISEDGKGGSYLPENIPEILSNPVPKNGSYKYYLAKLTERFSETATFQKYNNTAIYNPVCYFPQIIAGLLSKLFNLPVLITAYLMKTFNFLFFVILAYYAIKYVPRFKKILILIAINPMTLQEATSLAPDALLNGLALFLVAFVCYLAYEKTTTITKREYCILYFISIIIGLCKIVYAPLIALYLLIPSERFGATRKSKQFHALAIIAIMIIINGGWLMLASKYLNNFRTGVNSSEQMIVVLRNPLKYVIVIMRSIMSYGEAWLKGILGLSLGAFSFDYPFIYGPIALSIAVIALAQRDERLRLKRYDRIIAFFVFLGVLLLILTSEYIQWTPVRDTLIDGVQGRYFIAILPLIPIILNRTNSKAPNMNLIKSNTVFYYGILMNFMAFFLFFAKNI